MRRRFRCQMRPNCRSQSGRRPWICSGGCNATCAATADGSRDNSGGDAAAGSIPPAPQLQMAVETKAVRCSGDCDIKCATTADSSRDGGGGDAAAAATPAAAQLPTAVGTTAVAMRRRRRCGGGLDINCARTADGSQDEGGGNAAAAAKPAAPQRLTAVETTAMAMPAMPAIPPVSQLRPSCRRQSRGRRWRSGGRGDAATAAMTAAPHPQMALEMTAVAMQRRRRATCVTTADSSRDDGVAMWRRLRCHLRHNCTPTAEGDDDRVPAEEGSVPRDTNAVPEGTDLTEWCVQDTVGAPGGARGMPRRRHARVDRGGLAQGGRFSR